MAGHAIRVNLDRRAVLRLIIRRACLMLMLMMTEVLRVHFIFMLAINGRRCPS